VKTSLSEKIYRVCMYTYGSGSGHLSRVNAVYKGFKRAGFRVKFSLIAPRTKYAHLLADGIQKIKPNSMPSRMEIFICDWRADEFVYSLLQKQAKLWVGLVRIGRIPRRFPRYFHLVGLEPGVSAHEFIWPIITTWQDEILNRHEVEKILKVDPGKTIALLCENGCFRKHLPPVLDADLPLGVCRIECSNSPHAVGRSECRDIYPVAPLFGAIDYLVIGGGYNALHEARCYARNTNVKIVHVGGDDQAIRIARHREWPDRQTSQADNLARHLVSLVDGSELHGGWSQASLRCS
jgi:hypothetical protein